MALAIWRSKLLSQWRDGLREALPAVVPELMIRARSLPWPVPVQRIAKRGLAALAQRSKTAAWLIDRAGMGSEALVPAPFVSAPAQPSKPQRSLEDLAYALRAVSAETCVGAIADLTDRGDGPAGALLFDLLEDASGFFIPLTRLAAARGLQRVSDIDAIRLDRLLQYESDVSVRDALSAVSSALPRS